MRIVFVSNTADYFLMHRGDLGAAAAAQGWEVYLAAPEDETAPRVREAGFALEPIRLARGFATPWAELASMWELYRLFRRLRPDVVHSFTIKPVILGGIAARLAGVRALVSSVTGLGYMFLRTTPVARFLRGLVYLGYGGAFRHPNTRVVLENPDDLELLVSRRVLRVGNGMLSRGTGIDITRYAPRPEPAGPPVIVLPARMLWDKGIGAFVQAAERLREEGVTARMVLVGDPDPGNPSAIPEAQLRAWHADGVVEWWGHRSEMPEVYGQAHIVCLPTRFREGLSRVLLEAAACGRPIVATDRPGCRRLVTPEDNGLLVPVDDAAALAGALRRLIEHPELRCRMGARGRELVAAHYTVQQAVDETLAMYRDLLAG